MKLFVLPQLLFQTEYFQVGVNQATYTMKTAFAATIPMLAVLPAAMANFDMYYTLSGGNGISANLRHFSFFNTDPSCSEAQDATIWPMESDLSGEFGVRCSDGGDSKACFGSKSPSDIEEVEMRFNEDGYHWSKLANNTLDSKERG